MITQVPVVESTQRANFPFAVETKNTENWNPDGAFLTMELAQAHAHELVAKHPRLPLRVKHHRGGPAPVSTLPLWRQRVDPLELPQEAALWTGAEPPPALGARVHLRINNIGPGTVTGYAVEGGWLGVMVLADEATRPEWHRKQNPENKAFLAFGAEITALAETSQQPSAQA